jgi:hypothetical protein
MPRMDEDLYYPAPGTLHYNVRYVGGGLHSRATAHSFKVLTPESIEWVWIIEEHRRATPEEVANLCH